MSTELQDLIARFAAGAVGEILKTQTTYIDVVCSQLGELSKWTANYRIHFHHKRDFALARGIFTSVSLVDEHPLLFEYTEPFKDIYLASPIGDKQKFITDLRFAAMQVFDGWRTLERYLNPMPLDELLGKRYGLLMSAPSSFAQHVMLVAEERGIELNMLEATKVHREKPRALLLDAWHVVAEKFSAELLP